MFSKAFWLVFVILVLLAFSNFTFAAIDTNTLWVLTDTYDLYRIDTVSGTKVQTINLSSIQARRGIAVSADRNVWVTGAGGTISAISFDTNTVVKTISVGNGPTSIAIDGSANAWVANYDSNTVSRVDLARGVVSATINVGINPAIVIVGPDQNVWVQLNGESRLARINPRTNTVDQNISPGMIGNYMAIDRNNNIWLVGAGNQVKRIDTRNSVVVYTTTVTCFSIDYVAVGPDGNIYVSHQWSPYNGVTIINPYTYAKTTRNYDGWPMNIAFSGNTKLWVTRRYTTNNVEQLNRQTLAQIGGTISIDASQDALTYGDATGYILENIVGIIPAAPRRLDINAWRLDGNYFSGALPAYSYNRDGNLTIDFNVTQYDSNFVGNIFLDINYSQQNSQGTGSTIIKDLNLSSWAGCDDSNFLDSTHCSYDFNIHNSLIQNDGNYYLLFYLYDTNSNNYFAASDKNFIIDNTSPQVTSDNNISWNRTDANVRLTCTDNNSGCYKTYYRIDLNATSGVNYGSWTEYDRNILFTVDGNYALDFNAMDNAGNWDDTNTTYVLVDKNAPIIALAPDYNYSVTDFNFSTGDYNYVINFLATDLMSGVNAYLTSFDNNNFTLCTDNNYILFGSVGDTNNLYIKARDNADNNSATIHVRVNFILDTDNDGILDTNDNLFGNKTDVNYSGSGDLNVAINGMDANGSFDGTKTIRFYNESALFLEFDHNFSNSDLNMSQFTANVFSNSIIIKTNNQLHSTKTIYITDNGFTALCAKDADINSISQMSAGCTDTNEYNFTSCLGGSATISGVICTDLGSTIKFENLQHSAVRGTASTAVTTENLVSSGGSLSCSQYPNSDVCSSEETCGGNWIHAWDSMRCCSKQCVLVPKQNTAEALIIDGNNSSFFEKEYNFLLEKALPIFEKVGGQEEIKIKRLATDKEIKMVRSIRIYSIMTASGIDSGYYNEVTVLIKNISGKKLNGLEVVESVPKKILKKASMISSKNAYTIVEEDPVIKFSFQELVAGSEIEIKYDFNRTSGEGQILEQDFVSIEQPVVLLKMGEEDSCLGVICNDYDTCTSDGCFEGKCVFEENDSCTAGAEESWLGKWSWLLILVIVILIAGAFFLLKKSKK